MNHPPSSNLPPHSTMPKLHSLFNFARNLLNTPLGTAIVVGATVLMTEFAFMISIEVFLDHSLELTHVAVGIIDATAITLIVTFILYQRLKASEDKFRKITESAQDAIIMMDPDQHISFWNSAAERIFGYTATEALGKEIHPLIAPVPARDAFKQGFAHFQKSGTGPILGKVREVVAMRKGGEEFPAELSISATKINGKWHAIGIARDITERKQSEKRIERLSNLYATLSQCNKAIVYSNNKEELFMQVCRAAVESSGFKMAWVGLVDETSKQIVSVASYGDTVGYPENSRVSMDANDPLGSGPTGTAVRESEPVWCQDLQHDPRTLPWREASVRSGWKASAAIPLYQKGATVGVITFYSGEVGAFDESARDLLMEMASDISYALGIFVDKAEREKINVSIVAHEVELVRLNQRLQVDKNAAEADMAGDEALLASLGEGMIATDTEGKIITMNPAAEKMLGWNEVEVLGKKIPEVIPAVDDNGDIIPEDRRILLRTPTNGNSATLISAMYFIKKNGEKIPIAETATPITIKGVVTGTVFIFRDITSEKEIEKTRGDLLALASHQLRTPLSGTKWLIETLQKGIKGPLNGDQKEYLDELYKINERMTTLVVDMLGVLRMEGDKLLPSNKGQVSTTALLDTILETFTPAAKGKQLTLRAEKDEEHIVETDSLLLRNILESFVSNAMNYSNAGSEVIISVKKEPPGLLFAVKDSGIGIPKDEQKQLFERFYRASNAKIFNTKGTGLGLYIAATLAKKIGATLSFESEEGTGSTFYVHLPFLDEGVLPENTTSV